MYFQFLEAPIFLFRLTLFFVHAADIPVSDRQFPPNLIVKEATVLSDCPRHCPSRVSRPDRLSSEKKRVKCRESFAAEEAEKVRSDK